MHNEAIAKAIKVYGTQAAMARALKVKPPTISQLLSCRRPVPPSKCMQIERDTKGAVTRRDLRPNDWADYWPELANQPATATN